MSTLATSATTSLVTAAVLMAVGLTRWNIDAEHLGYVLVLAHAAAHTLLPLAQAVYGRLLAWVTPKAAVASPEPAPVVAGPVPAAA